MKRHTLLVAAVVVLASVPGPAAADNPIDDFVATDDESGDCLAIVQTLCDIRNGGLDRATDMAVGVTDDRTASDITGELRTTFNDDAAALESYANNRTSPTSDAPDVVKITVEEDGTSSVYLTTEIRNGEYHNTTMDASTSREVDESCVLEDNAARNAPTELDTFTNKFAEPGEPVTASYMDQMATRYAGNVNCTFVEVGS